MTSRNRETIRIKQQVLARWGILRVPLQQPVAELEAEPKRLKKSTYAQED